MTNNSNDAAPTIKTAISADQVRGEADQRALPGLEA